MPAPVLQVKDLHVQFHTDDGIVRAVGGVSFGVEAGKTLGIVGESGSGKSVTNLAVMGLVPQPPGRVTGGTAHYDGRDLLRMSPADISAIRGNRLAMIFQDPMTALNPFLTVERQLSEVTQRHLGHDRSTARRHAIEMLERVGISGASQRIDEYPHQFSGGMRQRVMIAMALACKPDVLIADEPTTALDVTIQAQILDLMKELQRDEGTAIVLITHDLGLVANMCDRVVVMYGGKIVEESATEHLFAHPRHPYTVGLLESVPRVDEALDSRLRAIEGQPPDPAHLPAGCAFQPRCDWCLDRCAEEIPALITDADGAQLACFVNVDEAPRREAGHV
jgi:oligopeptide transport system ATP-binding protein